MKILTSEKQELMVCIEKDLEDYNLNKKDTYYTAFYHNKKLRARTIKLNSLEEISLKDSRNPIDVVVGFEYHYDSNTNSFFSGKKKKLVSAKPASIKSIGSTPEEALMKLAYSIMKSDKSEAEALIQAKVKIYELSLRNKRLVENLLSKPEAILFNPYSNIYNIFIDNKEDVAWEED